MKVSNGFPHKICTFSFILAFLMCGLSWLGFQFHGAHERLRIRMLDDPTMKAVMAMLPLTQSGQWDLSWNGHSRPTG
jgi:hypothetical protein